MKAGQISGDLVFPIPYCPELHFSEFASAVADMKNSVADRSNAQSSCAGLFIASHLGFDYAGVWIHVDMATPVHAVRFSVSIAEFMNFPILLCFQGERATGYGVALLTTLFGTYCRQPLLSYIGPDLDSKLETAAKKFKKN